MTIKVVLLDLDHTLVRTDGFKQLSTDASIIRMQAEAMQKFRIRIPRTLLEGTMKEIRSEKGSNYEHLLNETMNKVGPKVGITDQTCLDMVASAGISAHHMIKNAYFAFMFPEVIETLSALKQRGLMLALATAGITHKQIDKINWAQLSSLFDRIYVTEQFIKEKKLTDVSRDIKLPEYFLWISEKVGRSPGEMIMGGDSYPNDIESAKKAGYWTFHVVRSGESENKGPAADFVSEDLTKLPQAIDDIDNNAVRLDQPS
ncbi:Glyceraldehyde 3-phosphate phosphatase [uncultured archaeon]|nr:Glyceraldehyde 3-phosphate phosphatase [uncultured archaeon]